MKYLSIIIAVLFFSCGVNAQQSKTIYRQTLIIQSGKAQPVTSWQQVSVNYMQVIYQYNRTLTKRREVFIVFGKEGISAKTDWMKYEPKDGDSVFLFKKENI